VSSAFGFTPTEEFVERWVNEYSRQAKSFATLCKFIPVVGWPPGGIRCSIVAENNTRTFGFAYADALFNCAMSVKGVRPLIRNPEQVWRCFVSPFDWQRL
jgi:hypothetical protein